MGLVVELGFDLVAGSAGAPKTLLGIVLGVRIAALDHEILDDAMETSAVIKALFGEFFEILHVARRDVRPEFENHITGAGIENGNFAHENPYFLSSAGMIE